MHFTVVLATAEVCNCTVVPKMGRHGHVCSYINASNKQPAMFDTQALHRPQTSSMCRRLVHRTFIPLSISVPSPYKPHCINCKVARMEDSICRGAVNLPPSHSSIHPKGRKSFTPVMWAIWRPCTSIWRKSWLCMLYFQTNINIA